MAAVMFQAIPSFWANYFEFVQPVFFFVQVRREKTS